jgi:hypothetical protein
MNSRKSSRLGTGDGFRKDLEAKIIGFWRILNPFRAGAQHLHAEALSVQSAVRIKPFRNDLTVWVISYRRVVVIG